MKIFVEICVKLYWIVSDNLQFLVSPYILWRRTGHASQAISSFEVRDFNSSSCLAILRVKGREVQCDVNKLLCEVIEAKYTG